MNGDFREDLKRACEVMQKGGVILYPTDTIWGIGCDATNPEAVKRVYDIKKRADSKAMLVLVDSTMNICFVMAPEYKELEADFLKFATERGMVGIKGHRSVGGFRASCYNAMPKESVQALIDCMQEFEKLH